MKNMSEHRVKVAVPAAALLLMSFRFSRGVEQAAAYGPGREPAHTAVVPGLRAKIDF
jgi:hypothetical protein